MYLLIVIIATLYNHTEIFKCLLTLSHCNNAALNFISML